MVNSDLGVSGVRSPSPKRSMKPTDKLFMCNHTCFGKVVLVVTEVWREESDALDRWIVAARRL